MSDLKEWLQKNGWHILANENYIATRTWNHQQARIDELKKDIAHYKRRTGRQEREILKLKGGPLKIVEVLDRNMELIYEQDKLQQQLKVYQKAVGDHNDKMDQEGILRPDYKVMIPIASAILKEEVNEN